MTIPKITTDLAPGDPEATAKSRVISIVEGLLGANAFAGAAAPANWGGARAALNTAKALAGVAQDDIFNNERGSSARAKINALNAARWWMDDPHLLDAVSPSYFLGMKSQKHVLAGKAAALASMLTVTNPSAIRRYFDQNGVLQLAAPNTPRISWSFGWPRLLLEGAATNFVRNSALSGAAVGVLGAGGALPTNISMTAAVGGDLTTEVVAIGAENGMPCIDVRFYGQNSTARFFNFESGGTVIPAATGDVRTFSVYLRVVSGDVSSFPDLNLYLAEKNSSGGNATGGPATSINMKSSSSSIVRRSITRTMTAADCVYALPFFRIPVPTGVVDFTLRIALPQCEAGSIATSPIVTNGMALTRTADLVALPASVGALTAWAVRGYAPALLADQEFLGSTGGKYIGAGAAAASFVFDGSTVGAMTVAAAGLPGNVALCGGFGASGRRASQSGAAAVSDAITADRSRAAMYLGGSGGLAPGQVLYLDELVGWALPDRPTAAGVQAQARAA